MHVTVELKNEFLKIARLPDQESREKALSEFWKHHIYSLSKDFIISKSTLLWDRRPTEDVIKLEVAQAHHEIAEALLQQELTILEDIYDQNDPKGIDQIRKRVSLYIIKF